MIHKVYSYHNLKTKSIIEIDCKDYNEVSKIIFNYLSLFHDITYFIRTGNTIDYSYKIENSLDEKNGKLIIHRETGGYPEGIGYKIK